MRKKILCLMLVIIVLFLTGCDKTPFRDFSFSYEIKTEQQEVSRGDRVYITVTLTNDSDFAYIYKGTFSDFDAHERLYCKGYIIWCEPYPVTDDGPRVHFIKPHQSSSRTYCYIIPDDAPSGDYDLRVGYKDSEATYYKVFTLTD